MSHDWTSQPEAERVLALAADSRPAWLWTGDGMQLIWHNHAATLFGAKIKHESLKRADTPTPLKGQISRIMRLGLVGRPMLSRMQFIAGRKPLSATCTCTPLALGDDKPYLLIVGADQIPDAVLALDPIAAEVAPDVSNEVPAESVEPTTRSLSDLVERLANDQRLFSPLDDDDDAADIPQDVAEEPEPEAVAADEAEPDAADARLDTSEEPEPEVFATDEPEPDVASAEQPIDEEAAFVEDADAEGAPLRAGLWQITGRGLTTTQSIEPTPQTPAMEPSSRYNFDELARILHDRVSETTADVVAPPPTRPASAPTSNLVSLGDETLVLNRLPLGILVFRDQDILFANRALVELTGYDSAATLRAIGLAAVIPTTEGAEPAGPISLLMRRDGTRIAVSARLNTVSWQGRSAMMMSARAMDGDAGREDEIRRFAADFATLSGSAYVEADKIGTITGVLGNISILPSAATVGALISELVAQEEQQALSRFMALPARFTETPRPAATLKGRATDSVVRIFALGRAGIVSGYSIVMERRMAQAHAGAGAVSAASLARIGRELRRPLNTIVGFSELIASESFGPLSNARYLEYARDINAAGGVITDLADEIDDYARIAEGKLELAPDDIDLAMLLADCLVKIRGRASSERVLLRSAISERLPLVRADAATLRQAILNMLASAITDAGEGSKVVVSAQLEDDGAVSIHVRDATRAPGALADQFVVFRDGLARDGTVRQPVRSSIGLTLTRTLVAVNACTLALDPASESGTLMTLTIPASLVVGHT